MDLEFVIENGVLTKYNGPGGEVVVPDGVTSIGLSDSGWSSSGAFEGCEGLTRITIPESVVYLGKSAFARCRNLSDRKSVV